MKRDKDDWLDQKITEELLAMADEREKELMEMEERLGLARRFQDIQRIPAASEFRRDYRIDIYSGKFFYSFTAFFRYHKLLFSSFVSVLRRIKSRQSPIGSAVRLCLSQRERNGCAT